MNVEVSSHHSHLQPHSIVVLSVRVCVRCATHHCVLTDEFWSLVTTLKLCSRELWEFYVFKNKQMKQRLS